MSELIGHYCYLSNTKGLRATVSARLLSLLKRLFSGFGIDSMRFLDHTGRSKLGRTWSLR